MLPAVACVTDGGKECRKCRILPLLCRPHKSDIALVITT